MPGPLLRVAEHGLDLEIFPEAIDPEFPTIAGLLVAAERQAAIEGRAIEIDAPCPDATGNLERALRVAGLYKARQAEGRVIGDFDRFVLGFVVEDGEDGSEDFFARNGHLRCHIAEYGGVNVVAAVHFGRTARAPGDQSRAFGNAGLNELLDLVELTWLTSGPSVVSGSSGSPSLMLATAALAASKAASRWETWTSMRVGD